jgi:hypothetical protein
LFYSSGWFAGECRVGHYQPAFSVVDQRSAGVRAMPTDAGRAVELQAKPGWRAELKSLLDRMITARGPSQHGFLGSTRYEVLVDGDLLVDIADWESAEAPTVHMQQAAATGAYAPVLELLAAPLRATVITQLPWPNPHWRRRRQDGPTWPRSSTEHRMHRSERSRRLRPIDGGAPSGGA